MLDTRYNAIKIYKREIKREERKIENGWKEEVN